MFTIEASRVVMKVPTETSPKMAQFPGTSRARIATRRHAVERWAIAEEDILASLTVPLLRATGPGTRSGQQVPVGPACTAARRR